MPENTQETRTALEEAAYHKLNKSVGEGTVVRVVGPVVDVKFDGQVPGIYTALIVDGDTPMPLGGYASKLPHQMVSSADEGTSSPACSAASLPG